MNTIHTDYLIIGGGITGLTLAFYLRRAGKKVLLVEKEERVGGVIQTFREKGFVFESGPNTGVVGSAELVELFDHLKDRLDLEIANKDARYRWIWKGKKWEALPSGLKSALQTPLFSWKDKFRILGEPFRGRGNNPDESVADLVVRRLGRSYLDYAVNPFISGVYAGDPERLITRYALPKLYNLEQKYGSFIRGAIRKKSEPKSEIEKRISREVFSVRGGLQNLTEALSAAVGAENMLTGTGNLLVKPLSDGYEVLVQDKNETYNILASKVISTIDGEAIPGIFPFLPGELMQEIKNVRYAPVVQVVAGYSCWNGQELKAFGGLVPACEKKTVLGILFPSSIFPNRAPEGGALLSVFMGGIHHPEIIDKSEDELKETVLSAIREMMGCDRQPDLFRVFKHPRAIPQYELSTGNRLKALKMVQEMYPGLIFAGNLRDGIGMSDRVKQGRQMADTLISEE